MKDYHANNSLELPFSLKICVQTTIDSYKNLLNWTLHSINPPYHASARKSVFKEGIVKFLEERSEKGFIQLNFL